MESAVITKDEITALLSYVTKSLNWEQADPIVRFLQVKLSEVKEVEQVDSNDN